MVAFAEQALARSGLSSSQVQAIEREVRLSQPPTISASCNSSHLLCRVELDTDLQVGATENIGTMIIDFTHFGARSASTLRYLGTLSLTRGSSRSLANTRHNDAVEPFVPPNAGARQHGARAAKELPEQPNRGHRPPGGAPLPTPVATTNVGAVSYSGTNRGYDRRTSQAVNPRAFLWRDDEGARWVLNPEALAAVSEINEQLRPPSSGSGHP